MKKLMLGLMMAFAVTAEAEIVATYKVTQTLSAELDDQGVMTFIGSGSMPDYAEIRDTPWFITTVPITAVVGEGEITVGARAFQNCDKLTTVSLPKATSIGARAFSGCSLLAKIVFPKVITVGERAFNGCASATEISLPLATTVGMLAFYDCDSATEISLPLATTVGEEAFGWCDALSVVSLPSAATIGKKAFSESLSLRTVIAKNYEMKSALEGGRSYYGLGDGVVVVNASAVTVGDFSYEFDADNHTAMILGYEGSSATVNLDAIEYQQASYTITSVGRYAFDGCSSLTEITFLNVTSVAEGAFRGCSALTKIVVCEDAAATLEGNRSYYGIGDGVKIVAIPKLTRAEVENADWEVKEAVVKVEYDITPSSVTLKSGEKTLDQDKYAYACEYYGVEVKQKPETPDTPSADDFKVVSKDAPIVEPDEIAVKKEAIQAPSAGSVKVENNTVQLGVTVLKTSDLTAEKKTWDKVKITKDNIDVDADGNIIVNVPVDSASGFMILQSKDAKIETAE